MTTTIYKLTDRKMQTRNGFQWKLGEWYETSGKGDLCGSGWLHCYSDPLLAVLLNPIHADIAKPRLFQGEGAGTMNDDRGLKQGYARMRIIKELPLPDVATDQRSKFAILCPRHVIGEACPAWSRWAEGWLDGSDRSASAAAAAAAKAAEWAAALAAAEAAWMAEAARMALAAARAAALAAARAAAADKPLDLAALAREAVATEAKQ